MYYLRKNYNFHKMVCTYSTSTYLIEITIGKVLVCKLTLSNVAICTVRGTNWKFIHLFILVWSFESVYVSYITIRKVSFRKVTLSNVNICTVRRTNTNFHSFLYYCKSRRKCIHFLIKMWSRKYQIWYGDHYFR